MLNEPKLFAAELVALIIALACLALADARAGSPGSGRLIFDPAPASVPDPGEHSLWLEVHGGPSSQGGDISGFAGGAVGWSRGLWRVGVGLDWMSGEVDSIRAHAASEATCRPIRWGVTGWVDGNATVTGEQRVLCETTAAASVTDADTGRGILTALAIAGVDIPTGWPATPYLEVGLGVAADDGAEVAWSVGAGLSAPLYGPISGAVGCGAT